MKYGIILALAGLLLAIGTAQAQTPKDCPPSERGIPGDLSTPCITSPEFEVERVEYRFIPSGSLNLSASSCQVQIAVVLSDGYVLPAESDIIAGSWSRHPGTVSIHESGEWLIADTRFEDVNIVGRSYDRFTSREYHLGGSTEDVPGRGAITIRHTKFHAHSHQATFDIPVHEFYAFGANVTRCRTEAYQSHLSLKHEVAEAQREAAQLAENAAAEAIAAAEEERAQLTAETSKRIDATRLESEKRVTATEAREIAVVEEMIQASIKAAAEITQIRIDRATARLESLERTATWLRDAAAVDLDEWNTFYKEVEQETIARVEALQVEAADALQEVQQIQDNLAADLAASVARQQALTLQLQSQGGASVDDLRVLRQNAVDWIGTLDGLIAEAESQ